MKERVLRAINNYSNRNTAKRQQIQSQKEYFQQSKHMTGSINNLLAIKQRLPLLDKLFRDYSIGLDQISFNQLSIQSKQTIKGMRKPISSNDKIQYLKQVYKSYQPIHEQTEEISRIIESLKTTGPLCRSRDYLTRLHEEYTHRGGLKSFEDLQLKLESDLMFLIKRSNQRNQYLATKYHKN